MDPILFSFDNSHSLALLSLLGDIWSLPFNPTPQGKTDLEIVLIVVCQMA
jgi:hypothetical protein